MLRRAPSRKFPTSPGGNGSFGSFGDSSKSKTISTSNGSNGGGRNGNDDDVSGRGGIGNDGDGYDPKKQSSLLPRSTRAILSVACVLAALLLLISRSSTPASRASSPWGGGGKRLRKEGAGGLANRAKPSARRASSPPLHAVGTASPATNATLHVVFSTDCGSFQHWQSYLFFHAALKVLQPGYVTRIASGCTDDKMKEERAWHDEHVRSKMSDRFRIHFTPRFSGVKDEATGEMKGDYKFFNKPFGLKHFMENNDLMGFDDEDDAARSKGERRRMKHPDDVVILTDPDFLLLRPLTDDFSNERETIVGPRRKAAYRGKETHFVGRGNPYAQTYGLGTQWRKFDLDAIAGPGSPAKDVSQPDGGMYYPAGPPYVVAAGDMYEIAATWSDFAPRVHAQYPHLLAEMYAYCISAAHLRLPHMLVDSLMVSAAGVGGEGWKFVKDVPARETCNFAANPNHLVHPVPSVVHYCQHYGVGRYFWSKRKIPHGIFTCDHPLLAEPPLDLGSGNYPLAIPPGKGEKDGKEMTAEKEKMEAFMVCALTRATNDAMTYFKANGCDDGANTMKTYDVWAGKDVATS